MIHFAVYNDSGEILRAGICSEMDLENQAGIGEKCIQCAPGVRDDTHRVVNDEVVSK